MFFTKYIPRPIQYAYRWDARAAWITGLFTGMTVAFFGVIARRNLHASALEVSLLIATPSLGHLFSILVAWHMQNKPKKPYLLWVGSVARGLLLLMAFATSSPLFIGIVVASQVIGCLTLPAYASIMKTAYPDRFRGRLMGLVRVGMTGVAMITGLTMGHLLEKGLPLYWVLLLAAGAAIVIAHEIQRHAWRVMAVAGILIAAWLGAPYLAHAVSYRVLFPIAGVFGLLAWWMFSHVPEAPLSEAGERRFNLLEGLTTLVQDRRFGLYSLAFFTFGFGNLLQGPLIPLFQVDELKITDQWVGILAMATSGVSAIFYALWGRFMDRYGPFLTVVLSFAICGLAPLVYANAHSVPTLMLASILMGIANPGIDLTWMNAVMDFTDREGIPRYTALHTFLVGIRGSLAPFVGVWMLAQTGDNLRLCFYLSALVIWLGTFFMAAVVWFVLRRKKTRPVVVEAVRAKT